MGTPEDRELAARAAAGEEQAWREIYDRNRDRLFALLCYHLGNRDEAMDVLQDVFIHAIQGIHKYSGEGSLDGWLAVIAIRRATDWKRRFLPRLKRTAPLEEARAVAAENPTRVQFAGEGKKLRQCLAKLSHHQRSALLLRELEEMSYAEIGEAIGCGEGTARVHHLRARERMQTLMKPGISTKEALCAEE